MRILPSLTVCLLTARTDKKDHVGLFTIHFKNQYKTMFRPKKSLGIVLLSALLAVPVAAHNVEVSEEVAATFHIEPNHNPRVGEPAQAWFALTRRGGKMIPLSECSCALAVYRLPRSADAQPVAKPSLEAIDAERFQGIPGASIVFPEAGAYELELQGTAKNGAEFAPFQLTYSVNVRP